MTLFPSRESTFSFRYVLLTDCLTSGTKRIKYLEENLGALDVKLSAEELAIIRQQIEKVEIVGERYSAALNGWSFGDTAPLKS